MYQSTHRPRSKSSYWWGGIAMQKPVKKVYFCDGAVEGKIIKILQKHYELVLTDKNPDYIFYSVMGEKHIEYDGIRIFSTGENVRADFNFCDYAIGFDYMSFEDRYLRYPLYLHYTDDMQKANSKHLTLDSKLLQNKERFCTFVVSNGKADELRTQFFDFLSQYKHIDSGGRYKNNIGKPVKDKSSFLAGGKFNIAFENSNTNGYTTEKLIQAFSSQTVPIYWGDECVSKSLDSSGGGVNPKAFIHIKSVNDFDTALEKIQKLDNDDEAYLSMLKEPSFLDSNHEEIFDERLENFLLHIFNQPIEKAYRRGFGQWRYNLEKRYKKFQRARKTANRFANIFKTPIQKLRTYIKY